MPVPAPAPEPAAAVSCCVIEPSSVLSFGSIVLRESSTSFCTRTFCISGSACWNFLTAGDSRNATSCLSSASVNLCSSSAPIVEGASFIARSRSSGTASSAYFFASASMLRATASRLSAGTLFCSATPAA